MLWIPFSSDRKRMTVAYALKGDNTVRLVVKGAPEYVVPMCNSKLNDFNQPEGFNDKESYLRDVIEEQLIKGRGLSQEKPTGLKAITIAYRDFDRQDFENMKTTNNGFEEEDSRRLIES